MFPKLHLIHLKRIAQLVATFGKVYVHGDGNMYIDKNKKKDDTQHPSDFAAEYSQIKDAESRVVFDKSSKLPETLEELKKAIIDFSSKEKFEKTLSVEEETFVSLKDEVEEPKEKAPKEKVHKDKKE
jgi:hypothetical protein